MWQGIPDVNANKWHVVHDTKMKPSPFRIVLQSRAFLVSTIYPVWVWCSFGAGDAAVEDVSNILFMCSIYFRSCILLFVWPTTQMKIINFIRFQSASNVLAEHVSVMMRVKMIEAKWSWLFLFGMLLSVSTKLPALQY